MVNYFDPKLDNVFMALADPVRRSVIGRLLTGERTLSALAEPLDMTMPAVMKHVSVLERCGIVKTEKRGRSRYCQLQAESLTDAKAWLDAHAAFWTDRLAALDQYLQENE